MPRDLTLAHQALHIEQRFPGTQFTYVDATPLPVSHSGRRRRALPSLQFRLTLTPTPTSDSYEVFFCVWVGLRPRVMVVHPRPVAEVNGEFTPHLMLDGSLCLYDAENREFTPSDVIAHTIVPWTERWLVHYEHWIKYGEWLGDANSEIEFKPAPSDAPTIESMQ